MFKLYKLYVRYVSKLEETLKSKYMVRAGDNLRFMTYNEFIDNKEIIKEFLHQ